MAQRKSARRLQKELRAAALAATPLQAAAHIHVSPQALSALELEIVGKVVLPWDPDYNQARQEFNPAFQMYPQVIVYCETVRDVALTIAIAQQFNLWIAVRSGGHSTAGYSVNDGGIVIDVSGLRYVSVAADRKTALVGPGTDFDTLNAALDQYALHVPSGACGSVCVGGFVQGGGYGYTSRMFGMNCDNVLSVKMILADGAIVTASPQEYSDLYWAVLGGTGGNFGVLLEVEYQLHSLPSVWAWAIQWTIEDAPQVLIALQSGFMRNGASNALGYMGNIGIDPSSNLPVLLLQGMFVGTRADGLAVLQPLLAMGSATLNADSTGLYGQMNNYLDNHPYSIPNPSQNWHEDKQSGYIDRPLSAADWEKIILFYKTAHSQADTIVIEPYGGAIESAPPNGNAFVHRAVDMDLFVDVFWYGNDQRIQTELWLDEFMALMAPYYNGEQYQNYPRRTTQDYRRAYWGGAFDQLLEIKQKYDPTNVFHYQQSIAPRGEAES